jgi:hypothetical protein
MTSKEYVISMVRTGLTLTNIVGMELVIKLDWWERRLVTKSHTYHMKKFGPYPELSGKTLKG